MDVGHNILGTVPESPEQCKCAFSELISLEWELCKTDATILVYVKKLRVNKNMKKVFLQGSNK